VTEPFRFRAEEASESAHQHNLIQSCLAQVAVQHFQRNLYSTHSRNRRKLGRTLAERKIFLFACKTHWVTGKNRPKEVAFCPQNPPPELFSNRAVACLDKFRTLPSGVHCTWNTRNISDRMRRSSAESSSSYGSVDSNGRSCSLDE
jgi:hypothetical protein